MGNCNCGNSSCCDCCGPVPGVGGEVPNPLQFQTVSKGGTVQIADRTTQVDVCTNDAVTLILPCGPKFGRFPLFINNLGTGTVTIQTNDRDIQGQNPDGQITLGPARTAVLTFTACGTGCGIWAVLFGEENAGPEEEELRFADIAEMAAFDATATPDLTRALVLTLDQEWELDKTSTAAPDGITIVAAVGGGNWLRIETFSKKWSVDYLSKDLAVTAATSTAPIVITTSAPHGLLTGDVVAPTNLGGLVAANGSWAVTVLSPTTFSLDNSSGVGEVFTSGGVIRTGVQIDPVNGNDENTGLHASSALKTTAEACRRLHQIQYGKNYQFFLLADSPLVEPAPRPFGTVPISDRFRPSAVFEQNAENIDPQGFESNALISLVGKRTYGATSTMTASSLSTGNVQFNFTDAAFPGAVGDLIEILNDPVTPANNGATGFVGRVTGAVVTTSEFTNTADARVTTAFAAGTTYRIVTLPKWNAPFTSVPAQGFCHLINIDMMGPDAVAPAERKFFSLHVNAMRFTVCRIRRSISLEDTTRFSSVAFVYPATSLYSIGLGQGIANKTVIVSGSQTRFVTANSLFINADVRMLATSENIFPSVYAEGSVFSTVNFNGFHSYIDNNNGAQNNNGNAYVLILGTGFRTYDWPVDPASANAGLLLTDNSTAIVQSGVIGGTNAAVGSIGVLVRSGTKLLIRDTLAPANATWINGQAADVAIRNPSNPTVFVATASQPHPLVAGVVTFTASPLTLWSHWTAAPFNGFASNTDDGSYISFAA